MDEQQYKDRRDEMIHVSMEMISNCGEADARIHAALSKAEEGEFTDIQRLLAEAKEYLNKAHLAQSHIIQTSIELDQEVSLLLFNHAQDIYMTKCNELLMAEQFTKLYKKMEDIRRK